ncbi:hypothetical protein C8J57DRAFT_1613387 [Mycena rebaudengoi]|nr:hypothetical protein C8J57DRAFT_1613387 [Mycena rebaudengoi]
MVMAKNMTYGLVNTIFKPMKYSWETWLGLYLFIWIEIHTASGTAPCANLGANYLLLLCYPSAPVLIALLVMSNWNHIVLLLSWSYTLASRWVTTSTILLVYGLVLIYLLLVVHVLAIPQKNPRRRGKTSLVPYYDGNGKLQGWVREERETTKSHVPHATLDHHEPRKIAPSPSQTVETLPNFPLTSWDGFPDHRFRSHFTRQQVEDTSQLAFYWIYDKLPGKRGSLDAVTPEKGKRSSFKCAGIIQCTAMVCTVQIAPGKNTARQMEALCICGSTLRYRSCKVEWSVVFYRDGAIFENSGPHNHSKYTHLLPVSKKTLLLQEFISRQPVVFRGSQTTMNSVSRSDISQISEEEHNTEGSMNIGDSDKGQISDDQDSQESGKEGDEMNSEDERLLDPEADEEE